MKTRVEISRLRDAMIAATWRKCDCSGTEHEIKCYIGGKMMQASVTALDWALGEAPDFQKVADELIARAEAESDNATGE